MSTQLCCDPPSVPNGEILTGVIGRPDYGSEGVQIDLISNFIRLKKTVQRDIVVTQYSVDINNDKVKVEMEDKLIAFWRLVETMPNIFTNCFGLAYDGDSVLFTEHPLFLPDDMLEETVDIRLVHDADQTTRRIKISIKMCGPIKVKFKKPLVGISDRKTAIQVVNVILSQGFTCPFARRWKQSYVIGRTNYLLPPTQGVSSNGAVEIWSGLYASAVLGDDCIPMINVDVCHAPFYRPQPLLQYICDVLNGDESPKYAITQLQSQTRLSTGELSIVGPAVTGLQVWLTGNGDNDKRLPISGIAADASLQMVTSRDGRHISVADHYRKALYPLRYTRMPAVKIGRAESSFYVPMEFCHVANKQRVSKENLTNAQMRWLERESRSDAVTRLKECTTIMDRVNFATDEFIQTFGMQISGQFVEVTGRVLRAPVLHYKRDGLLAVVRPSNGVWRINRLQLFEAADCNNFSAIVISSNALMVNRVDQFCRELATACVRLGMNMSPQADDILSIKTVTHLETTLEQLLDNYKEARKDCRIVFVFVNGDTDYKHVKYVAEKKYGVMTQCVTPRVVDEVIVNHSEMLVMNLCYQVNMKLGGVSTGLLAVPEVTDFLTEHYTLMLGVVTSAANVGHTAPPSAGAVVGNVLPSCTRYGSSLRIRTKGSQWKLCMREAYRERITQFFDANNNRPCRIIVFCSGMGEDQLEQVLREEFDSLCSACSVFENGYRPRITFIAVQDDHHAVFTCKNARIAVGSGRNIPAGTVIDRQVTSPDGYDFYLCSSPPVTAAITPSKYHVLYDENNLGSNVVQAISYHLCYAHGRSARSSHIPAPLYLAQIATSRAREHVNYMLNSNEAFAKRYWKNELTHADVAEIVKLHEKIQRTMYFV
uniref:Piwi domain-containing protein n=1 Tax=Trichuris muris TaxID=70415 RepID=A0A5S6QD81_TRIMR